MLIILREAFAVHHPRRAATLILRFGALERRVEPQRAMVTAAFVVTTPASPSATSERQTYALSMFIYF